MSAVDAPRRRSSDTAPPTRDPADMQLYAMPPGESLQRLRCDFVALDKMLATMDGSRFTGYLRVHGEGLNGVVLLLDGGVVESLFDMPPVVATGERALGIVGATVARGEGELDIVALSPEVVTGLYQLLTAPTLYENLFARFVDVPGLLEHLGETKTSGSVVVTDGEEHGVVLLREGAILAAYTADSDSTESAPEMVMHLCENPATAIEVRTGPLPRALERLELAKAISLGSGRDLRTEVEEIAKTQGGGAFPRRIGDG
ncbi:MAG: hypothetical protein NVSMB17_15800 [Candidatus Dormibacteria bacterium]